MSLAKIKENEKLFSTVVAKLVGYKSKDAHGYFVFMNMKKINIETEENKDGERAIYPRKKLRNM